jgi:hypothetical protein
MKLPRDASRRCDGLFRFNPRARLQAALPSNADHGAIEIRRGEERVIGTRRGSRADEGKPSRLFGAAVRRPAATARPVGLRPWPCSPKRQRHRWRRNHPGADPNLEQTPVAVERIVSTAKFAQQSDGSDQTKAQAERRAQTAQLARQLLSSTAPTSCRSRPAPEAGHTPMVPTLQYNIASATPGCQPSSVPENNL